MFCQKCGKELEDGALSCASCGEVFATQENNLQNNQNNQAVICPRCQTVLEEGQGFCPKCGLKKCEENKKQCFNCGIELLKDQDFCPNCGKPVNVLYQQPTNMSDPPVENENKKKKSKIIIIIVSAVVATSILLGAIVGVVIFSSDLFKKDFVDMYSELETNEWCTIDRDGKWMKLDSNPDDIDSDDLGTSYYYGFMKPCCDEIEKINLELGFTSALMEKMDNTTWSQGVQTEENDDYKVTWTYHPDKGLEVMYEMK